MANLTGEFINATTANSEINKFLDIRNKCYFHAYSKLQSEKVPPDCLTYYSDLEISFIFDRTLIQDLFNEIDQSGQHCNALRIYYAADPGKNGSTTVVLVGACYDKVDNEVTRVTNVFPNDQNHAAIEYPGGGIRSVPSMPLDIRNDNLGAGQITSIPV